MSRSVLPRPVSLLGAALLPLALLAVAPLAVAPLAVAPLGAQQVRVTLRDSLPRRDSVLVRRVMPQNVDELLREVMQLRERETKLAGELRAVSEQDVVTRRRLIEELQLTAKESFALMSVIEARCNAERSAPEGFLGINLENTFEALPNGRVVMRNSVVKSVEPGSPAQGAGLAVGDRLLAVSGRSFENDLPDLTDLLTIGRRVVVRSEREGNAREVTLTVARRPESFGQTCGEFERALQPLRMAGPARIVMEGNLPRRRPIGDSTLAASQPRLGGVPADEVQWFVFMPNSGGVTSRVLFAGAEFRTLDDEWREVLGLKSGVAGVFVNEVAQGSPAAVAGLRKGDVVTAVGKSPATSPEVMVRLLNVSRDEATPLTVLRGKDRRTLTWAARSATRVP
jgi:C-terminal processing protease CtpA/Prc